MSAAEWALERMLADAMDRRRAHVTWLDVWLVVKASALKRLGKPLLLAYLGLAVMGALGVAASVLMMRLAP
jgi:hypothetical protein